MLILLEPAALHHCGRRACDGCWSVHRSLEQESVTARLACRFCQSVREACKVARWTVRQSAQGGEPESNKTRTVCDIR